jgi:hypothetical protein
LDDNDSDTPLALDGLQALCLMIIATDGSDNPGESSPWAPFYSASGQPALPIGDSPVFATRLPEEEAGNASSLWVHFSAIPLPPDHGLPLGFVASPLAMTSARAFITELEAWSHLKDHLWDWMDNPFFDAWFSAQARDPNSFVLDICSTKQIDTHWQQWVDDTTPRPDNHAVHFGTNNAMQHVKAALRHRVFRDNLLANATPSMATKNRDFERRALQVFRSLDDPNPSLGTLPAALQPYLYCLAHPSAKSWMAKLEVQHDLSLAPSYVKPFVPFDLPSATGVNPTVTSLVTLNASFALDSSGTPGAHSLNLADTRGLSSADALAKLMEKALVTSPGKSPNRRLSQKKAPSRGN